MVHLFHFTTVQKKIEKEDGQPDRVVKQKRRHYGLTYYATITSVGKTMVMVPDDTAGLVRSGGRFKDRILELMAFPVFLAKPGKEVGGNIRPNDRNQTAVFLPAGSSVLVTAYRYFVEKENGSAYTFRYRVVYHPITEVRQFTPSKSDKPAPPKPAKPVKKPAENLTPDVAQSEQLEPALA